MSIPPELLELGGGAVFFGCSVFDFANSDEAEGLNCVFSFRDGGGGGRFPSGSIICLEF